MIELRDKNCFITGAASGIGRSFALALAKEGMNLFITDIDIENLEKVKKEVEEIGANVYSGKCDVSKFNDFENIAEEFYTKLGDLDLLINNAGMGIGGSLLELELEDWKEVLDVNLWSVIHSLKVFAPRMIKRASGHIVNVASGAGVIGTPFEPLPYITSKFAVVGLSEALFGRLHNLGINVSVIIPTYVRTNIFYTGKIRYPKKLLEDVGEQKLEELRKSVVDEVMKKASSPNLVVKKYIRGIKKNQLYIYDANYVLSFMAAKGTHPQSYENFLKNMSVDSLETIKKHYEKFGINIEDYT